MGACTTLTAVNAALAILIGVIGSLVWLTAGGTGIGDRHRGDILGNRRGSPDGAALPPAVQKGWLTNRPLS
jgi:hypothetical protein